MGSLHRHRFPSIGEVLDSHEHQADTIQTTDANTTPTNSTASHNVSQEDDVEMADVNAAQESTDSSLVDFLRELDSEPSLDPEVYDSIFNYQEIPVEFNMPPPRTVPEDAPPGGWTYSDDNGRIVGGKGGWIPPIMEEDPDFIRFSTAMPHLHLNFQTQPNVGNPSGAVLPQAPVGSSQTQPNVGESLDGVLPEAPVDLSTHVQTTSPSPIVDPGTQVPQQEISGAIPFDMDATRKAYPGRPLLDRHISAGELLGERSGRFYRKFRIPRGLQRIMTAIAVEESAVLMNSRVPFATDDDVSRYFRWQQQQRTHPFMSFSTPVNVDIRLLGAIGITPTEIIAFFPNHLKWKEPSYRLARSNWSPSQIVAYLNYSRQLTGDGAETETRYREFRKKATKLTEGSLMGHKEAAQQSFGEDAVTAQQWTFPNLTGLDSRPIDYYLVDLAEGVVNMPTGNGAWLLTYSIRYAVEHSLDYVKLSQIHDFIRTYNIVPPQDSAMNKANIRAQWIDTVVKSDLAKATPPGLNW